MQFYTDRGFLERPLHWQMPDLPGQLTLSLNELADSAIRKRRSERGFALIDGQGTAHLRQAILSLIMA